MLVKSSAACGGGSPAARPHWLFFLGLLASICDLWTDRAAPDRLPHPHPTAAFCAAHLPSPFSRQSQCPHLRIPRPPLVGGAVPRCPRSPVQTSAPVPVPVPVFAPGSG